MLDLAESTPFVEFVKGVAWPLTVIAVVAFLLSPRGQKVLRPILPRLRKVSGPGGWGVELSPEAAATTNADVEGTIKAYSAALDAEFRRLESSCGIFDRMESAVTSALTDAERDVDGFRATVHVRDVLLRDTLYQIVDYYPTGPGAGRRFSQRFGIIGRAWRGGRSLYEKDVPTDANVLIDQWGMTRAQADAAGHGHHSFVCVILIDRGVKVGILYMDAKPARAFPDDVATRLEAHAADLSAAVGKLHESIAGKGPMLRLFNDG